MRLIANREALLAACQIVSAAIPSRDIKPILKNIKAVASDGRCTLMATDLQLGIRLDVQGLTIQEPGEAILPASRFIAILRECRETDLTIDASPAFVKVIGPTAEFELTSESADSFPEVPTFVDDKYHEITAGTLREMIRRTVFATADDAGRYSMTGVLWELEDGVARLIATDGKRLAVAQGVATAVGGHGTGSKFPVVPSKAMSLLEKNLSDDAGETVRISIRANEALFRTARAVVYSRLVEGRFPDYRVVLPKKAADKITLTAGTLNTAVRQASICAAEDSKRVEFTFQKDKLTLEAKGESSGRSKVELAISYGAKNRTVQFNPQYLLEVLRILPPEAELVADLIDEKTPVLFHCDGGYRYLVMPLQ